MCTKGRLVQADRQTDWFGMTHSAAPPTTVSFDLKSGESAYLEVKIDPAAHGPDAIGPIERGVSVKLASGQIFTVDLTANVTR
jgi:hypothetical protein